MKKYFAFLITLFFILINLSNVTSYNTVTIINQENEPDVVKKQLLIESAKITDIGMQAAKDTLKRAYSENITEAIVADAAASAMVDHGSSEYVEAFGVMVASGEQSALPHGDSSDDKTNLILPGEVVVIDLGARYKGYCTDLTRTFFMGEPTEEMVEIYNIVLEAQEAGITAVRAGVLARDVDKAARDIISNYGYGDNFTHGLGHGIGIYIHMPPTLSPNSKGILMKSSDMAITIEPGIYLTGNFGVRIEDDVMVTRLGYELITHFPKGIEEAVIYPEGYDNSSTDEKDGKESPFTDFNLPIAMGILLFIAIVSILIILRKYEKI
jgi:Xaa-Pro aminopeptidase